MTTNISIVYHSKYGHTAKVAHSVHDGAASVPDTRVRLIEVGDAQEQLASFDDDDAIILGSPTYMGSVSADFKSFMEATAGIWQKQGWKNKLAGGFTNSLSLSGDKLNTLFQLVTFAMQHGMLWVGQSELNASPDGESGQADSVNRVGSFIGLMAQSDNASPEVTPPSGDLKTAVLFGTRIAELAKSIK